MIRFYRPILLKAGEFKGWFKKYRNDLIGNMHYFIS